MGRIETPAQGEATKEQTRKLLRASANVVRGRLARNALHASRSPLPVRRCFLTAHRFAKAATLSHRRRRSRFRTRSRNVSRCRRRQGVVNRLADSRTKLFQPFGGMVPVHDTADESELGCNVAAVPTDVLSCRCGI